MKTRFFIIFLLIVLLHSHAYAHSPYLLKQKIIKDSEGNAYILETRNGDSVIGFSSDPYVLQIRTMSGHVVAITKAQLPTYCFALEDCRVLGKPGPVRFDAGYIKKKAKEISAQKSSFSELSPKEKQQLEDYLMKPEVKYCKAFGQGYPEHEENFNEIGVLPDDRPYPLVMILFNPVFLAFVIFSLIIFRKLKKKSLKHN